MTTMVLQASRKRITNFNSVGSTTLSLSSTTLTQTPPLSTTPAYLAHAHYCKSSSSTVLPGLPDLPEPPSPVLSNSSAGSGLPSPPVMNSMGSGSTGDPRSIAVKNGAYDLPDGDVVDDLLDEDTTAWLRLAGAAAIRRHTVVAASSEIGEGNSFLGEDKRSRIEEEIGER